MCYSFLDNMHTIYTRLHLSLHYLSHVPTACYLPGPSADQYQFVYVDGKGEVCSHSSAFTFSAPKPLEELVTVEHALEGGEGNEDMLVVIPKAELLQVQKPKHYSTKSAPN